MTAPISVSRADAAAYLGVSEKTVDRLPNTTRPHRPPTWRELARTKATGDPR
jgi:hypothetical protein